jgi:hypothetical protein
MKVLSAFIALLIFALLMASIVFFSWIYLIFGAVLVYMLIYWEVGDWVEKYNWYNKWLYGRRK